MDEFFNFEDAATQLHQNATHHNSGDFDVNLAFADLDNDEDSFTCLQHFAASEEQLSFPHNDTTLMGPDDFTDFPRWIDGMFIASKPCDYCQRTRIHCKVIKEGRRKGSCTSCVALARPCSLTDNLQRPEIPPPSGEPSHAVDDGELVVTQDLGNWWFENQPSQSGARTPIEELPHAPAHVRTHKASSHSVGLDHGDSGPKVGARFSRESLKVLKGWLSTHHHHPYPTEDEKEQLQRQTGLNKTQITNWLANARRRGKVRPPRSTSPSARNYSNAIDIPRRGTPVLRNMDPMERWKNSPPEHEPASVTAIARAVTNSSFPLDHESPYTSYGHTDDGSNRSICNISSTSSLGTSLSSGGSFASAFSHKSRGSFGSFGSFGTRGRRRRRRAAPKATKVTDFIQPPARTFQCTFCTETFKTKHDWQRHEKTLHLSLERWVCSPDGPNQACDESGDLRCVYCGLANPPRGHDETHNHSSCAERSLEERTFYRKDHLRQHLNLVHDVKFQNHSMEAWKVATPEIRSRCGFCGIVMDTWSVRVDHLAEHFKGGKSMADWKGDWGFEPQVLDIVENGMPPYLIHDERNSIEPFEGSRDYAESKRTLEDQVKIALVDYLNDCLIKGVTPTDEGLLIEARTALIKAESGADSPNDTDVSWFRDLIKLSGKGSSGMPRQRGRWGRKHDDTEIQSFAPERVGLTTVDCSKDRTLRAFVNAKQALGLTPSDAELQAECCRILDEAELTSTYKCKGAVSWFKYLITASNTWLSEFRRRAGLPRSCEIAIDHIRNPDASTIDHSINNPRRLFMDLAQFVKQQHAVGNTPSDTDLQRQARLIIYQNDDPWNQTAMDEPRFLQFFKRKTGLAPASANDPPLPCGLDINDIDIQSELRFSSDTHLKTLHWDLDDIRINDPYPINNSSTGAWSHEQPLHTLAQDQPSTNTNPTVPLKYFLNDANCYNRLVKELARFVASCMSPNNPKQHLPTDAEIQNQARWIIYDDDDPWNQTAADNAEWLVRFKRHVGLTPSDSGPGLPIGQTSWRVCSGGSGFSPPYLFPGPGCAGTSSSSSASPAGGADGITAQQGNGEGFVDPQRQTKRFPENVRVTMKQRKTYNVRGSVADHFLRSVPSRYEKPAAVFCARELESGLAEFLQSEVKEGRGVSDECLQRRAREILGVAEGTRTAADEVGLLRRFREVYGGGTVEGLTNREVGMELGMGMGTGIGLEIGGDADALMTGGDFVVPELVDALLASGFDDQLLDMDFAADMGMIDVDGLDFGIIEGDGCT